MGTSSTPYHVRMQWNPILIEHGWKEPPILLITIHVRYLHIAKWSKIKSIFRKNWSTWIGCPSISCDPIILSFYETKLDWNTIFEIFFFGLLRGNLNSIFKSKITFSFVSKTGLTFHQMFCKKSGKKWKKKNLKFLK
jgi:hypothetical protein